MVSLSVDAEKFIKVKAQCNKPVVHKPKCWYAWSVNWALIDLDATTLACSATTKQYLFVVFNGEGDHFVFLMHLRPTICLVQRISTTVSTCYAKNQSLSTKV